MIKISVIIPVYNVEDFLRECLDSVINQTYRNLEIIIINDQTPDSSQLIIDEYAAKDERIIPIIHEVNKGLGGARNTGILKATGDYLAFLDSDDWLVLNSFELLTNKIKENPSDIIKFGYIKTAETSKTYSPELPKRNFTNGWKEIKNSRSNNTYTPICWRNIYKTEFIKKNKLFFPEKLLFEDIYFSFRAHVLSSNIDFVNEHLYCYRIEREGSIMYTINQRDIEVCTSLKLISEFIEDPIHQDIKNDSEFNYLMYEWSSGTTIYRYLKTKGNKKIKSQVINEILTNKYYIKYLDLVLGDKDISLKKKFPVYLLKNNFTLFKFIYSLFIKLRG